jgi:hypothetical protein
LKSEHSESQLTDDPELNPFVAPTTGPQTTVISTPEERSRWLRFAWPTAVVLHLPVPLWFGWFVAAGGIARLGMFAGIAIVYGIGRRLCSSNPWLMKRLAVGSMITSVSQFWPMAQMLIGMFAISVSAAIFSVNNSGRGPGELDSFPGVALATILTGLGLIIPSLIVGMVAVAIFGRGND